jgi:hypothetical protein
MFFLFFTAQHVVLINKRNIINTMIVVKCLLKRYSSQKLKNSESNLVLNLAKLLIETQIATLIEDK